MENIKQEIKEEIPEPTEVLGSYDEMEEKWIKYPKYPNAIKLEKLKEMSKFVRATIVEILRISPTVVIKEVEFCFIIDNKKVSFSVNIEELRPDNKIKAT